MAISPFLFLTNWIDLSTCTLFFVNDDSSTSEQFVIKIDLDNIFIYIKPVIFYFPFTSLTRSLRFL